MGTRLAACLNRVEGNKYSPSLEVVCRIAHVFNVALERVFQYDRARARAT
jgi:DNA-binding XRE family transcriptional regulator